MVMKEKILSSDYRFQGRIFRTRVDQVELDNGYRTTREICEHNGGVCVIALNDKGEVLLEKQFRSPYGEVIWEVPAGKLEKGEDPLVCGKRELSEETGYEAEHWRDLNLLYPTPAYCSEIIYTYYATGLKAGAAHPDDNEFVDTVFVPLDKAVDMVLSGEIKDGKTQIAILKVDAMLQRGEL